jgi:hypothetical protein
LIFEGAGWVVAAKVVVPCLIWSDEANLSLCWLAESGVKKADAVQVRIESRLVSKGWIKISAARSNHVQAEGSILSELRDAAVKR